jgi:hypothetical protein
VIHNRSDHPLNQTRRLDFVRGAPNDGRDDFNADRIPGDAIAAGGCFRLVKDGVPPPEPSGCTNMKQEILLDENLFFWRTAPVNQLTFEVRWDSNLITRCDTVGANDEGECRFANPTTPEEE